MQTLREQSNPQRRYNMDRISELSDDILHRILYFLSQEDAVRTSVLSKSWREFWCTRPNLDFSDETFKGNKQKFLSVVDNTLQRYCDQRLRVEEFHLCISLDNSDQKSDALHLEKWIQTLADMCTKKFRLSIRTGSSPGFVRFPPVVFGAESVLEDLHVEDFYLDQKAIERIVPFKHLRSLRLERVCIDDEIFETIISNCPSIETLVVNKCKRLKTIKVGRLHNLKDFFFGEYDITRGEELCRIEIHPPSLETIDIRYGNLWFHKGAEFRNLNDLSLGDVELSLDNLSSCKFPSLEYLKFSGCPGLKGITVFIDAPKILRFEYGGNFIPSFSFATTTSGEWDSEIHISYRLSEVTYSWFVELHELLKSLSQSEISLNINQYPMDDEHIIQENINLVQDNGCNKLVVVERLRLRCHLSSFSFVLNGALSICRPRNIGDYYLYSYSTSESDMEVIECLWKILVERESGDEDQFARDLDEVSLEICERDRDLWQATTLSELPNYRQQRGHDNTRFALKWRETL
ncbi:hypothetical protein ABFS83_05G052200 [Erythranthe nasuta]